MTGAGRLSSGPQPVTANAAPLFLSCIVIAGVDDIPLPLHLPSGMEAYAEHGISFLMPSARLCRAPGFIASIRSVNGAISCARLGIIQGLSRII